MSSFLRTMKSPEGIPWLFNALLAIAVVTMAVSDKGSALHKAASLGLFALALIMVFLMAYAFLVWFMRETKLINRDAQPK